MDFDFDRALADGPVRRPLMGRRAVVALLQVLRACGLRCPGGTRWVERRPPAGRSLSVGKGVTMEPQAERIDAVFAEWNRGDSPGCALDSVPEYAAILRDVRDAALALSEAHWRVPSDLADLFKCLAPGLGTTALKVLREWFDSDDPERIMGASLFLREAPRAFVFDQEEYAACLLAHAGAVGEECCQRVIADLETSATLGMFSSIPGEPSPNHIMMLERATPLIAWLLPGSTTHELYERIVCHTKERIRWAAIEKEELEG